MTASHVPTLTPLSTDRQSHGAFGGYFQTDSPVFTGAVHFCGHRRGAPGDPRDAHRGVLLDGVRTAEKTGTSGRDPMRLPRNGQGWWFGGFGLIGSPMAVPWSVWESEWH